MKLKLKQLRNLIHETIEDIGYNKLMEKPVSVQSLIDDNVPFNTNVLFKVAQNPKIKTYLSLNGDETEDELREEFYNSLDITKTSYNTYVIRDLDNLVFALKFSSQGELI